ncbi:MAG TPA: hypothetical protein IAB31_11405 [Candidatus Choladousia intestinavium]|uniref:Uncharacterized protein n=1 Tax=Candidatus Choladousia intestinavium TaxID=2840727 RepID=A0A9D1ADI0_9FIRM|nr:hypothetical protein [Candidatus Choladousia intestinavium]
MDREFERRMKRRARRLRERRRRRIFFLFGMILFFCLLVGIAAFIALRNPVGEEGGAVSREGLESLVQTAGSIDQSAYPDVQAEELQAEIDNALRLLEGEELSEEELNEAYAGLLDSIQNLIQNSSE